MFGTNKNKEEIGQVETVIGQDTNFKGTIVAKGSVRIDGELDGEVKLDGDAVIGETGKINAQIKARNVVIAGTVHGNVEVVDKLEILPTGKLYGDIKVEKLAINEGAVFKGGCAMHGDVPDKKNSPKTTKS